MYTNEASCSVPSNNIMALKEKIGSPFSQYSTEEVVYNNEIYQE